MLGLSSVAAGRAGVGSLPLAAAQPPDNAAIPRFDRRGNCQTGDTASVWDISGKGDRAPGICHSNQRQPWTNDFFKGRHRSGGLSTRYLSPGHTEGAGRRFVETVHPSAVQTKPHASLTRRPGWWTAVTGRSPPPGMCRRPQHPESISRRRFGRTYPVPLKSCEPNRLIAATMLGKLLCCSRRGDTTWQAYNSYQGNSCIQAIRCCGWPGGQGQLQPSHHTRLVEGGQDWVFNAEYPDGPVLEANGYDVSYVAGPDVDRGTPAPTRC